MSSLPQSTGYILGLFDKTLKFLWIIGVISTLGLLAITERWPPAFPTAFGMIWVLSALVFWRRHVFFPELEQYPPDVKHFVEFVGWFLLAMIGLGCAGLWMFGGR